MIKSEAIDKLLASLKKAQSEFPAIPKNGYNPHFKSKYTLLDDVIALCSPVLHKNDLLVTQTTAIDPMLNNRLITTLFHTSGQFIQSEITLINKAGTDQGIGSSISYCRRYSWIAMLGLSDNDDDANESVKSDKVIVERGKDPKDPKNHQSISPKDLVYQDEPIDWSNRQRVVSKEPPLDLQKNTLYPSRTAIKEKELEAKHKFLDSQRNTAAPEPISVKQIDQLREVREAAKLTQDQVKALMKENFKKEDPRELEKWQLDLLITLVRKKVSQRLKQHEK